MRLALTRLSEIDNNHVWHQLFEINQLSNRVNSVIHSTDRLVQKLRRCILDCNYHSYFELIDSLSGYQKSMMLLLVDKFRHLAYSIIAKAYLKLPIGILMHRLRLESESTCMEFLQQQNWLFDASNFSSSTTLNFKTRTVT